MRNSLLIDVGHFSCGCTDHALESIYKAQSLSDDSLFQPHHDPFQRDHLEEVTARLISILNSILAGLMLFITDGKLRKADQLGRWSPEQLRMTRELLQSKAPDQLSMDDWMLLVDWLIQRYLPPDVALSEAEYMAVRSNFAGRLQAAMEGRPANDRLIGGLIAASPVTLSAASEIGGLSDLEYSMIEFARARGGELITDIGERARHRIKQILISHQESMIYGEKGATVGSLETKLRDEFSILNRDFRRIAITETARDTNEGYISSMPYGTVVKRIEAYETACSFCKSIHGQEFTVVDPSKEGKDGWKEVWVGKTNVGRSSSPRKRSGDELVERTDAELWWPAAGTMHPNCRGTWVRVSGGYKPNPEIEAFIQRGIGDERKG